MPRFPDRISRGRYALVTASTFAIFAIWASLLSEAKAARSLLETAAFALAIPAMFALLFIATVARLRDMGRSELLALLLGVPLVGGLLPVALMFAASQPYSIRRDANL